MTRPWVCLRQGLGVAASAILTALLALGQGTTTASTHSASTSKATGKTSSSAVKAKSTASKSTTANSKSSHSRTGSKSSRRGKHTKKVRGQQKIDGERTHQIQVALIRQHYLNGEPTGKWDPATEDALRRFQADNGWQNKTVPDSRALIKLGLGPNHDHLLNPESAMTSAPDSPSPATPAAVPATSGPSPAANQPQQ